MLIHVHCPNQINEGKKVVTFLTCKMIVSIDKHHICNSNRMKVIMYLSPLTTLHMPSEVRSNDVLLWVAMATTKSTPRIPKHELVVELQSSSPAVTLLVNQNSFETIFDLMIERNSIQETTCSFQLQKHSIGVVDG